jgi:DNA-binding CsgD family transcriptional regulator
MSEPAVKLDAVLRVAIVSNDPARRARLAAMVAAAGHAVAPTPEHADIVLADGDATTVTGLPTVSLGGHDDEVAGRLAADATTEQIDAALRAVASGLVVRPAEPTFEQLADENLGALLTPREIEVLSAVSAGLGNKAIARSLDISLHTVKFHLESIFRKLGVRTRAEAVARGLQRLNL